MKKSDHAVEEPSHTIPHCELLLSTDLRLARPPQWGGPVGFHRNGSWWRMEASVKVLIKNGDSPVLIPLDAMPHDVVLYWACKYGRAKIANAVIARTDLTAALMGACREKNLPLARYILSIKNATIDVNAAMIEACRSGDMAMIQLVADHNGKVSDQTLAAACKGKNTQVVEMLIGRGCNITQQAFDTACKAKQLDLIQLLATRGDVSLQRGIESLLSLRSWDGVGKVVSMLLDLGLTDYTTALYLACRAKDDRLAISILANGNREGEGRIKDVLRSLCILHDDRLIESAISDGYDDWDGGLEGACLADDPVMAENMIERGARDFNRLLKIACRNGRLRFVKMATERGANDWGPGFIEAIRANQSVIICYLIREANGRLPSLISPFRLDITLEAACVFGNCLFVKHVLTPGIGLKYPKYARLACSYGHISILKLLRHTLDEEAINQCLSDACEEGHTNIATYLIQELGADATLALMTAAKNERIAVIRELIGGQYVYDRNAICTILSAAAIEKGSSEMAAIALEVTPVTEEMPLSDRITLMKLAGRALNSPLPSTLFEQETESGRKIRDVVMSAYKKAVEESPNSTVLKETVEGLVTKEIEEELRKTLT